MSHGWAAWLSATDWSRSAADARRRAWWDRMRQAIGRVAEPRGSLARGDLFAVAP
jgi:hypothetical protein